MITKTIITIRTTIAATCRLSGSIKAVPLPEITWLVTEVRLNRLLLLFFFKIKHLKVCVRHQRPHLGHDSKHLLHRDPEDLLHHRGGWRGVPVLLLGLLHLGL